MSSEKIVICMGNPTAGGTDGVAVSTNGTYSSPLHFDLNAAQVFSQTLPLAIRTESGYITNGATTISIYSDTYHRYGLCLTADGEFTDSITISTPITDANVIFYVRAFTTPTEINRIDSSASLLVKYLLTTAGGA